MIDFKQEGKYCVTIMGDKVVPGNTRKIFNAIICQKQETQRQPDGAEGGNLKKSRKRRGSKNKKTIKKIKNKKTIKKIRKQAKRKIKKRTRKYRK